MSDSKLSARPASIYYSPKDYWKGIAAIQNLSATAKVSENVARGWLKKQAIWQIYLTALRDIPQPTFDIATPNEVHQAYLLFLPHDRLPRGRKTYKYAFSIVAVASRYKEAQPLATKEAKEVAEAPFQLQTEPVEVAKMLQVDPGREFMGAVNQLLIFLLRKTRCRGQARSYGHPPGPGDREAIQMELG